MSLVKTKNSISTSLKTKQPNSSTRIQPQNLFTYHVQNSEISEKNQETVWQGQDKDRFGL